MAVDQKLEKVNDVRVLVNVVVEAKKLTEVMVKELLLLRHSIQEETYYSQEVDPDHHLREG